MPTVTAVIVTFNRAQFLGEAIQSVLNQTYANLELLVLDNSSTDNTPEIVGNFSDSRISYLRHSPRSISESRNLGLSEAKGEFIAYLDDNDGQFPQHPQHQGDGGELGQLG